jgi:gp16 family phage-associated protein
MSTKQTARVGDDAKRTNTKKIVLSGDEVKTRLKERGLTLKEWAAQHGYPYDTVSAVVRGVNRGTFGMGHRIATALGLK